MHFSRQGLVENRLAILAIVLLSVRLWMVAHLGLGDDEGYYCDRQNHLALGYFDHPPLTGWIVWLTQLALPKAEWAVRLPFVLLTLLSAWPFFKISERLGARRPFQNTLYLYVLIPLYSLGGFMVFPDVPMLAAWIWALYLTLEIERESRFKLWFALGTALGFALLAKLTALLLGFSILLWSLSSAKRRRDWFTAGPWFGVLTAMILFSPALYWNWSQGFPTLKFQLLERHAQDLRPSRELAFVLVQLAVLSPLALIAAFKVLRERRTWVWCFALPSLLVFWLQPLKADFMMHWTAPAYLPLLALIDWQEWRARKINLVYLSVVNILFSAICLFPLLPGQDFSNDFYGWSESRPWLKKLYQEREAESPRFLASRYQIAGNLSFYSGHDASAVGPRANAYRYFANYPTAPDKNLYLFVADNRYTEGPEDVAKFESCHPISSFAASRLGRPARKFQAWECRGFLGLR